ncbi:MAG: ferritin-like domain-containing protein [Parachlamydia sp.]|nr:ferritin-like domain-containing protein [Parachlamydia sp.]
MKNDIHNLFVDELQDMLSAENQIVQALPEYVKAAESSDLKDAFNHHLQETKNQVQRLEKIFKMLKIQPQGETCEAMEGLIKEAKEVLSNYSVSPVRDAAMISKAQRIEHYEISAYGTLRTFAKELDYGDIADLLKESENEEANADKKLTKIAEGGLLTSGINRKANKSSR